MPGPKLNFDPAKLKEAAQKVSEIRDNVRAVKGDVYERHLSFFIALSALTDLIVPELRGMSQMVFRDIGGMYIITANISEEDQKEIAKTIDNLEKIVSEARPT